MRWGTRLLLDARGLLVVLGWADAVTAQDLDEMKTRAAVVHLTWEAPDECPQREEVLALVQIPKRAPGNLVAHATVREAQGGYHLSLTTEQEGQKGHRRLTAANCKELGEVTAALLSLSLASVEKADEVPPPIPPPPPEDAPKQPQRARQHPTSLWVDLGVRGAAGPLPRASAGPLLRLALERDHLRLELGGYGLARARSTDESPGSSHYLLMSGLLSSCFLAGNEMRWGACAGVEIGRIEGESEGISQVGRNVQPWVTPHAALVGEIRPGPFAVQIRPVLGVPLIRPQFSVEPFGTVFQPRAVVGAIELSVGLRF